MYVIRKGRTNKSNVKINHSYVLCTDSKWYQHENMHAHTCFNISMCMPFGSFGWFVFFILSSWALRFFRLLVHGLRPVRCFVFCFLFQSLDIVGIQANMKSSYNVSDALHFHHQLAIFPRTQTQTQWDVHIYNLLVGWSSLVILALAKGILFKIYTQHGGIWFLSFALTLSSSVASLFPYNPVQCHVEKWFSCECKSVVSQPTIINRFSGFLAIILHGSSCSPQPMNKTWTVISCAVLWNFFISFHLIHSVALPPYTERETALCTLHIEYCTYNTHTGGCTSKYKSRLV